MSFCFTGEMRRVIAEQRLAYVATVCSDNTPNLAAEGSLGVFDDSHLVFADIKSPQTVSNLRFNSAIEVNVVDPFLRRGFRFKGRAEVFGEGAMFDRLLRFYTGVWLDLGRKPPTGEIRNIVLIQVERSSPMIAPAYERGDDELEMAVEWERYYRELLLKRRTALMQPW
jgi:uncharacterized protein